MKMNQSVLENLGEAKLLVCVPLYTACSVSSQGYCLQKKVISSSSSVLSI